MIIELEEWEIEAQRELWSRSIFTTEVKKE
jgi:hypothetical protein